MTSTRDGNQFPDDVITLSRDLYGYFAVYTCVIGSVFTEGGYASQLVPTLTRTYVNSYPRQLVPMSIRTTTSTRTYVNYYQSQLEPS